MGAENPAVFLSYASQDAAAAKRICESLRAMGIEVWFDQSNLRGGDAWDAKIKQQIRECTLFIPIISANTQTRLEGYFRREWRMAVDRMHDMADAMPFLLPVVIDATSDAEAHVPERFRERQWTRLPDGHTDRAFVERLAALLAKERDSSIASPAGSAVNPAPSGAAMKKTGGYPQWLTVFVIIVGVATGVYYSVIRPMRDPHSDRRSETNPSAPPITDERPYFIGTVAVLPPQVIAGSPESAAFADGLHAEMITQLSAMRAFDVVSHASLLQSREPDTSARAIGRARKPDFVVEISLQGAGAQRRVTMQLIDASTDRHIAAEAFNRTLEPEETTLLFQKELAWEMGISVYRSLKQAHPPTTASRERLEQVVGALTAESKALQIRFWGDDGKPLDPSLYDRLMNLTRQVIAIDPDNADAHTDRGSFLGHAIFVGHANFLDENWRQELLLTLKRAVVINPDSVDSQRNLGRYYLITEGRPSHSLPYLQAAVRLADADEPYPNNWPYYDLASALHQTGQSVAALSVLSRAPQEPAMDQLGAWIGPSIAARRFAEALAFLQRQAARLETENEGSTALLIAHLRTDIEVKWTGDRTGLRPFLERIENDPNATAGMRARYRLAAGDYAGVLRELAAVEPGRDPYAPNMTDMPLYRGLALERTGNEAMAHSFFRSVLNQFSTGPQAEMMLQRAPAIVHATTAFMQAGLGQETEMRAAIARARAATDPGRNYQNFLQVEYLIALAFAQAGATADACATINQLLSAPVGESTGSILANVSFDPLHGSPEFQAVIRQHADQLKDPAIIERIFTASDVENPGR